MGRNVWSVCRVQERDRSPDGLDSRHDAICLFASAFRAGGEFGEAAQKVRQYIGKGLTDIQIRQDFLDDLVCLCPSHTDSAPVSGVLEYRRCK